MNRTSLNHWVLAARPKTLPASVMPVMIGCVLASYAESFQFIPALICFLFALLVQIVSNFLNDYFDFVKGSDRTDRLGPGRAVANGWITPKAMLKASIALILLACLLGLGLIYYAGWTMILVGIGVCTGAFAYSSGPYPLAYKGWGDLCVVVFYGIIPVGFTYYVQALDWTLPVSLCGLAMGIVSTNILVANNYRDREQDKLSRKNTTIVLFGAAFGRWFYLLNGIVAVLICLIFIGRNMIPAAVLPVLYLLPHILSWKEMCRIDNGSELNVILEQSARNTVIFGLLLSLGILIS